MFKEFGLLARLMAHCAILTLVGPAYILVIYYLFADRGYTHGNPYVQVPYKAPVLLPYQTAYNGVMSKIRMCACVPVRCPRFHKTSTQMEGI